MRRTITLLAAVTLLLLPQIVAQAPEAHDPENTVELSEAVSGILTATNTPGAAVALVDEEGVSWAAGFGRADIAADRGVTPDTLFRVGSISKSFVSLAVLKLQEEGKLNLEDRLRDLAPDVEFVNPWEATDPVRLVHLLEHTAGFDDIPVSEYAHNDPNPVPLSEGLKYYPGARTCRWSPGLHFSYSNSGPAVAARVVEEISGQAFEEYVRENLFEPLGMNTASFLLSDSVRQHLAKGYQGSETIEAPYWHILSRPAGALNASARELASLVALLINRGTLGGRSLFRPESITRMEKPTTTLAASEGIQAGYGLGNYTSPHKGFLFHGHAGGIDSFLAGYGYLPRQRRGYVFMINKAENTASKELENLLRNFLVRDLPRPRTQIGEVPAGRLYPLARYYEPITPRQEMGRFLDRILGVIRIKSDGTKLSVHPFLGSSSNLLPVTDRRFRGENDPLPSVAFLTDPNGDLIVQGYSRALDGNFRSVPAIRVAMERVLWILVLIAMLSSPAYSLTWIPGKLLGKTADSHLSLRVFPLLGVLTLAGATSIFSVSLSSPNLIWRFGNLTPWSFSCFLLTWLFAIFSVVGMVQVCRIGRKGVRPNVWLHSLVVSAANCVLTGYLFYWGIIGIRTWA